MKTRWCVPILYQEQHDPQLFARIPTETAPHSFIGRSRELLVQERLLQQGALQPAFEAAERLLQQSQQAGEQAYAGADYDLAMANISKPLC